MEVAVDNPGAGVVDNAPIEGQPSEAAGTDTTGGQAQGGAPEADIFKGIDPNTLTPKEKAIYNSMLSDYRSKTGKLSETVKSQVEKEVAAYREKATRYEQIVAQEEFVKQWNDYVQKTQAATGAPPQEGDPVLGQLKAQLQEMNQKIQMSELSQITESFADAVNEKGEKLRPDFDHLNSIVIGKANGKEEYSLLRASIELAPGNSPQEKLANGYKMAKETYNTIFEAGRKAGLGRVQAKALNGTLPPTNSTGDVLSVTEKKPRNAHEAMQLAKKGILVSRE
jgi:hypothetical protein